MSTKLNSLANQTTVDLFVILLVFFKLVLEEMFFQIGEIGFGTDMVGQNAYYLLRHLIQDYKVNPNEGIKEWGNMVKML